jgi:hypothetical protein
LGRRKTPRLALDTEEKRRERKEKRESTERKEKGTNKDSKLDKEAHFPKQSFSQNLSGSFEKPHLLLLYRKEDYLNFCQFYHALFLSSLQYYPLPRYLKFRLLIQSHNENRSTISVLIPEFNKYLLSIHCISTTVASAWHAIVNKKKKVSAITNPIKRDFESFESHIEM